MKNVVVFAALAICLPGMPARSFAQSDEIQVYDGSLAPKGVINLTLHGNITPKGIAAPAFAGGVTPYFPAIREVRTLGRGNSDARITGIEVTSAAVPASA